jgi:diadenosine tetraphosphatase ApaH/serine/threonine PP2A family protein phosphatase
VVSDWKGNISRTISIDRLPEEGKRLTQSTRLVSAALRWTLRAHGPAPAQSHPTGRTGMASPHPVPHGHQARMASEDSVDRRVIHQLLRPREWATQTGERQFALAADDVIHLCNLVQPILEAEPTLLQLSAPIKIFGDLHGQYTDLMRIFEMYGIPKKEGGDIGIIDYLFLGDYVDRGKHSLETMVLLLALKVSYPRSVFLVRGNHESPEVNARDGFLHECVHRLGGRQQGVAVWRRLNLLFEWMPMAATINGCILCVHGGIGRTLQTLDEIRSMQRPLRVGGAHAELMLDLLWSDPTKSDEVHGVHLNGERGAPVVCFGPDRVNAFLQQNGLKLIVRGHECVMDGFQRFAGGKLITIFSATNYCNRWKVRDAAAPLPSSRLAHGVRVCVPPPALLPPPITLLPLPITFAPPSPRTPGPSC